MNESPDPTEGKAYRQSPDSPDLADLAGGRARRGAFFVLLVLGLAALVAMTWILTKHPHVQKWLAPALAGGGVIFLLLSLAGMLGSGRRGRSLYRFDTSSSRALNTLSRMHSKD